MGPFKEVYSNVCMKIHISFKLTQYLINIFKMRFLMINCSKYVRYSNAKMKLLRKRVGQQRYPPYSVMWISPRCYVNILSMGNPLIPDAGEFKNRYVKANINL